MDLTETEFYKKYIGDYAKRFYTPFEKQNIVKIVGFKMDKGEAYIEVEQDGEKWFWDMDDSVIITNEPLAEELERVANVNHERYIGYNPFNEFL
jgi:hypothetical protein